MNKNYSELLPPMLYGEDLKTALTYVPEYDDHYNLDPGQRIIKLMDIYKTFVPSSMAFEVYHKLYMMTVLSLKQKGTIDSVKRLNRNHINPPTCEFNGVITGASSATIIGDSGIGKTSCVQKAVGLIGDVINIEKPMIKIIPILMVSCPFDCNYKGLLCQILISLDEALGTNYYEKSQKSTMNAQQMLALVCQLCHLHVGVLIIDEIQFLVQHKAGTLLYKMILQLINTSGIGVVLVGTNECLEYFTQAPQMARRMAGLQYGNLDYDSDFRTLAETLFSIQYVKNKTVLTEGTFSWLYEHTAGNPANLMALMHDAQEIAILNGTEALNIATFTTAYTQRMQMLRGFIESEKTKLKSTSSKPNNKKDKIQPASEHINDIEFPSIESLIEEANNKCLDVVTLIKHHYRIQEIEL